MAESSTTAKETVAGAASSATTAVVGAAATAMGLGPEVSAALGVFAGAVPGIIRAGFQQRAERRCSLAQHGIAQAAIEYEIDLSEIEETPTTQECFLTMFHDLMDAVDDAAAAPLGHLAMSYVKEKKSPDAFFRSFGRVVRELDRAELGALEALMRECATRTEVGTASYSDSEVFRSDARDPSSHKIQAGGAANERWSTVLEVQNGLRLLSIIKQHGLGVEPTDVPGTFGLNPVLVRVWTATASRALVHLRQGRVATPDPNRP